MGPTWGRQDPGGTHVGPMNLALRANAPTATVYSKVQQKKHPRIPSKSADEGERFSMSFHNMGNTSSHIHRYLINLVYFRPHKWIARHYMEHIYTINHKNVSI